jgi:protein-S-isoprenylcysteine O-methyltransferase Ste14
MSRWRQLLAIAVLPGTVAVVIPGLIAWPADSVEFGFGLTVPLDAAVGAAGGALFVSGAVLWLRTVTLFSRIGRGTLAPWDPTTRLVVEGPYKHVRNPMITAVIAILMGEGLLLGSPGILAWAGAVFALNAIWFPLVEEPELERKFGDDYRAYKRNVPRWVPRPRPWDSGGG